MAAAFALALTSCGPRPFVPERPHPTPEQISALARVDVRHSRAVSTPAKLSLLPQIVMAGGATWVTCHVPAEHPARRIRYGVEGIRISEGPLERIQNRILVERIACGRWLAVCLLSNGERHEAAIEVAGCEDR